GGRQGSYTIPDSVTNLADQAFWACWKLTNVVVNASIVNIYDDTFGISAGGSLLFKGNAPTIVGSSLINPVAAVYYLPGKTGWAAAFGGVPALLWNPIVQRTDGAFGVSTNGFGFNITGTPNIPIAVDAVPTLSGTWTALQSASLTNGSYYFNDS